jgi:hemerythrin-like domain-containing protein
MDKAIDFIKDYMQYSVWQLKQEHESKNYAKLSECPSYKEVEAYCKSHNALIKHHIEEEYQSIYTLTPSKLIGGR